MNESLATYGPAATAADAGRIDTQMAHIRSWMLAHGAWKTLYEIEDALGVPSASGSAQLRHLRKGRFGAFRVEKRRRRTAEGHDTGTWEYRVSRPRPQGTAQGQLF